MGISEEILGEKISVFNILACISTAPVWNGGRQNDSRTGLGTFRSVILNTIYISAKKKYLRLVAFDVGVGLTPKNRFLDILTEK